MRSTPALRLAAAGLGALVLLAIVALASRGGLGDARGTGGRPSSTLLDYGFTIFLVVYALSVPFALWAYFVHGRESRVRKAAGGGRRGGLLAQLLLFVLVVGVVATIVAQRHIRGTVQPQQTIPTLTTPDGKRRKPVEESREPRFRWEVVVALGVLAAAGTAALLVRRRRTGELGPVPTLAAELEAALEDAIDDVRAETDPRRAVIKAYARMEAILAAHGLPRREAEAPYEFLARALAAVAASGASAARLTDLYEEARFSTHAIPPELREEAIAALTAVRDDLRAAAA
jgi:hypothetical protein